MPAMDNDAFDRKLVEAAFTLIAERGWRRMSVAEAARQADLPLDQARARFPVRAVVLLRFGLQADQAALALAPKEGPHRDRLFDLLMRRFDFLQTHRPGVLALLRALPAEPCVTALLTAANRRSMAWMLEGAGISARGPLGRLRTRGLLVVWLAGVRAWRQDTSTDLSATMAALDRALTRAEQVEGWLACRRRSAAPPPEPEPNPPEAAPAPAG
ncbi:MAG: TetR family transcriptional regulator [Alphaproteobacteria bacterium]|nr:TetR family transcriptional regulator [Alphaproteobacteria bacterium]